MNVALVLVTRGNVPLDVILDSYPPAMEKVVWNNTFRDNLSVYGRYAAIAEVEADYILVQDDDVVLPPETIEALMDARLPDTIVANQPERFRHDFYTDHCLVGFGAVFHRDLPEQAWGEFFLGDRAQRWDGINPSFPWSDYRRSGVRGWEPVDSEWFGRTCDIVFTGLTPRMLLDLPYTDREFASAPNRMWRQPEHVSERTRMLELVRKVRDA